jgi:hypothetical protein
MRKMTAARMRKYPNRAEIAWTCGECGLNGAPSGMERSVYYPACGRVKKAAVTNGH